MVKKKLYVILFLFQVSCTMHVSITDLSKKKSNPEVAAEYPEIALLSLLDPTSSPGMDDTPTIRVSGVTAGDTVKLYNDALCSIEVGSGFASGSTIDITANVLSDGTYNFYAQATNSSGLSSACSTATVQYILSVPTQLVITQQPTDANSMAAISPAITVELRNASNQLVDFATSSVAVTVQPNGVPSAELGGTLSVAAVKGVATFNNLNIDLPRNGYVLQFTSGSINSATSNAFNISALALSVNALFPINGSNWMDYVHKSRPSFNPSTPDKSDDQLCEGEYLDEVAGFPMCWHGGEIRKVILPGFSSCSHLTMADDLAAFNWTCSETSDPVYFYSELKETKGLKDLLTATAFINNKVTLKKDTFTVGSSSLASWWTNPISNIALNPTGAALALSTAGTIYTVSTTGTSRGIQLTADKTALVVLGSNIVSNSATLASSYLVKVAGNQTWVEGNYAMTINQQTIVVDDGSFGTKGNGNRIQNVEVTSTSSSNVIRNDEGSIHIKNVKISGSGTGPRINLTSSGKQSLIENVTLSGGNKGILVSSLQWYAMIKNASVTNTTTSGIEFMGWHGSIINSKVYNNGGMGIDASASTMELEIQNSIITSNSGHGIKIQSRINRIRSSFIANNSGTGILVTPFLTDADNLIDNTIIVNNQTGVELQAYGTEVRNSFITNNDTGIKISGASTDNKFTGKLTLGNVADCSITTSGADPGLTGASCNMQGTSNAIRVAGISSVGYFKGAVSSESSNTHSSGTSVASSITDWFHFDSFFRMWGKDGAQSSSTIRGQCSGATACRIWDYSFSGTAPEALGVNGVMTNGLTCPTSIHGDNFFSISHNLWVPGFFYGLTDAAEILGDKIGNDNGVCESNESCYFLSNLGPDQGSGPFTKSCIFENGTLPNSVVNVKMYGR